MTFLSILGVAEICSFILVLDVKTGKEVPESSRLEFLETFSTNNFALWDAEDKTSRPLNREGIADLLLLRTLLEIQQQSLEPGFCEVVDCFVLLAYARRFILLVQMKTEFKDILPWNISKITKIIISYAMKQSILLWIWWKGNGDWDNNMIRISQWRENHCRTNTSIKWNK